MKTVIVIGGGAGGCGSALALANAGLKVKIIEKASALLLGTSNATPGRMGLGFHYIDFGTGAMYMKQNIEIVKKFPGYRLAEERDANDPLRHGRYFIVKNSLFPKEAIIEIYKQYQQEYARLVAKDPSNKVFGEPENFFRILDPKEYANDVNMDLVEVGIETAEHLMDWPRFREFYIAQIHSHPNIEVLTNYEVKNVQKGKTCRFEIMVHTAHSKELVFQTDYAVNATWEQMEKVRKNLDIPSATTVMRNRLKVLLEVELPETLRNANSMFFCMGPHCMFSNMGNGRGLMSYAPQTNICDWKAGSDIPNEAQIKRLLMQQPTEQEIQDYGNVIQSGVSQYIPQMKKAKILNTRFGIVKIPGNNADIFDCKSDIHKRDEFGVEELIPGWFENNCMKLMFFMVNGELVLERLTNRIKNDGQILNSALKRQQEKSSTAQLLESLEVTQGKDYDDSTDVHKDTTFTNAVAIPTSYEKVFHAQTTQRRQDNKTYERFKPDFIQNEVSLML
jgi:hypothetical protein